MGAHSAAHTSTSLPDWAASAHVFSASLPFWLPRTASASPHLYARRARRQKIGSSSPLMFTAGAGCGGWNGFDVVNKQLGP